MLEAKDLHKIYQHTSNSLHVLKGIQLFIEEGDILSIIGPSGAGKSTLLHILGALDRPDKGQVFFEQQDIYRLKNRERAALRNKKIGFIFQFYHLLPEFTALENVILPALVKEDLRNIKSLKSFGIELLDRVGLKERSSHRPYELSGGEQQRVAIARALVNDPKIIFCDEPTGNLDSKSGEDVIDLLIELNKTNNQTIVIVTHDKNIAQRAHKILQMNDGELINTIQ